MARGDTERHEAIERLRESIKPGDTIHTQILHVSRSGMLRIVGVYRLHEGDYDWLSYNVAKATGQTFDNAREGVKVGGCGFDAGFHVVYDLAHSLWPKGFGCIGEKC